MTYENGLARANLTDDYLFDNMQNLQLGEDGQFYPMNYDMSQGLAGRSGPGVTNPLGGWQKFSMGMNALTGLAGILGAKKNYDMMKKQFNFQKDLTNRNIANEAAITNRQLADKATMASQMLSGAELGTAAQVAEEERQRTTVDGSPI